MKNMIREFTHNGNEVICGEIVMTLSDFKLIYPTYDLPNNTVAQNYKQGVCRRLFYADGNHTDIEGDWEEGNEYILEQYTYLAKIQSTKMANNPTLKPCVEPLIHMPLNKRKRKLKQSPYNKLTKDDFLLAVKKHRNDLLRQTDWIVLPDSPIVDGELKSKWLQYRKNLRDLPQSTRNPFEIVFPESPQ